METGKGVDYLETLQNLARSARLGDAPQWHKLMHYHASALAVSTLVSYVDDPRFFLSSDGKTHSENELLATLEGFFAPAELSNEHPSCRFPARRAWLIKKLQIDQARLTKVSCSDYDGWRKSVNASRLSLIFPSAYINSPSSMFGHTLFRFDPENVEDGTDWLSWSLSFGANIDASDSSIAFAYRGIFGGYDGLYTMMRYFEKIKEYNYLENRDIWEYELDVSPGEVDTILAHTWELKDMRFDYFFLDENCAFRLLELVELVRTDVNLTGQFGMTAIPADTVRAFAEQGLVVSASFKPSATTELKSRIRELTVDEAALARTLADDATLLESEAYKALSPPRKARVVQIAFSFLRYRQLKIPRDEEMAQRSHQLLRELNRLPSDTHQVAIPARPEQGHKTRVIGGSLGKFDDHEYGQFDFRVTYHDLLDSVAGYPKGAHIAMGNAEIRVSEGQELLLNRFDFIDIVSLSDIDQFFVSPSWHVKTGYEKVYTQHRERGELPTGAYYVKAGGGAAWALGDFAKIYTFADARLENNSDYKAFITPAFGVSAGILGYFPAGTLHVKMESDYFTNDDYRVGLNIEQNIVLDANNALRVGVHHDWLRRSSHDEFNLSYRHYF